MRLLHCLPWLAWTVSLIGAPPSPSDFQVDDRLQIELWASEPDVVDPVALAFDDAGNAYVAECRDYPYGVGPDGRVGSTIRLLRDSNGDGRPDRAMVFAEDLSYVTSVIPWRGGVVATAAPDLLYLKDTNGDGRADVREKWITGFHRGVSDSLVNSLRFGPDNRIHGANGGNGGRLRVPKRGDEVLELGDADFSLEPNSGSLRRTSRTGGGFGLVFNDWGHSFTTYNIDHIQQRHLCLEDFADQPGFPNVPTTASISDHGEMAQIFPISTAVTRPNHPEQSGHFSAAGGMGHLSAAGWPEDLQGAIFVCDVVGNLVHREVLHRDETAFRASRATNETHREFLASRDPNFRPVAIEQGPDGALYLLDMQRDVIEHPDYIPAKVRSRQDIRAGSDRGRIWRITPRKWGPRPSMPAPPQDAKAWVRVLGHPDQWWRMTAQRVLIERTAVEVCPELRAHLTNHPGGTSTALLRLHSLWTLAGLGGLDATSVNAALGDPVAGVREAALQCLTSEPALRASLASRIRAMTHDPSAGVRFRAVLALKGDETRATAEVFRALLIRDGRDPWIRRAVLASVHSRIKVEVLDGLLDDPNFINRESAAETIGELAALVGADPLLPSANLLSLAGRPGSSIPRSIRLQLLRGLHQGLALRAEKPAWDQASSRIWDAMEAGSDDEELATVWRLAASGGLRPRNRDRVNRAKAVSMDPTAPVQARLKAIELLALTEDPVPDLVELLDGRQPVDVQFAAIAHLRMISAPDLGPLLIQNWRRLGTEARPKVLSILLDRRPLHEFLVKALEDGRLTVGELALDLEQRRRLLRTGKPDIARRAARFVSDEEYSNRRQIVEEWLTRLPPDGEAARGRKIFEGSCAQCHRCADIGIRVGPDLSGVAHRSVEDLLGNILDPNMAINPGFVAYLVETKDGETHVGLPGPEAPDQVTLLQAAGQKVSIPKRDIQRFESSAASLMPEGLEGGRTPQDLRDLIAFIQSAR